jgi:hypothetical protein
MALRPHVQDALGAAPPSPKAGTGAGDLTPEQEYRVRVMGEEVLELLRAAASQEDGLHLAFSELDTCQSSKPWLRHHQPQQ